MKIIIAPDSFKECLPSPRVAAVLASELRSIKPGWEVVECPLSDGGEGFADIVTAVLGGKMETVEVTGPLGKPVIARFGMVTEMGDGAGMGMEMGMEMSTGTGTGTQTGIIEAASACGLQLVPPSQRNPRLSTSRGVGELMMAAFRKGCTNLIIGLGGTATCDGGEGLLSVPGIRSLAGRISIKMLCDVSNPFVGPRGAARVFAPQKGADAEMVEILEDKMVARARKILSETGVDVSGMPGAGAAGGIAGALAAYFGAVPESGIDAILDCIGFHAKSAGADWIITGEGRSDLQTLSGKVPMGVLRHKGDARVALLSGRVSDRNALLAAGFDHVDAVTPEGMPLPDALRPDVAEQNLRLAVRRLFN